MPSELERTSQLVIADWASGGNKSFLAALADDALWLGPTDVACLSGRKGIRRQLNKLSRKVESPKPTTLFQRKQLAMVLVDASPLRFLLTWKRLREATGIGAWKIALVEVASLVPDIPSEAIPAEVEPTPPAEDVAAIEKEPPREATRLVGTLPDRSTLYLPYEQIIYAQSKGRHTLVHCENGTICELLSPLRDIARDNPALLRVHASYLVNPRYVTRIARFQLTLADGTTIPVPERRYTAIKSLLSNSGTVPELLKRLRLEQ